MKYYVGVGDFRVIQYNPDKTWLGEVGLRVKDEPVYVNGDTVKIVACLHNQEYDFITFATFELENSIIVSKAGKHCFINGKGQTQWATSEDELTSIFHSKGDIITAKEGEPFLYDFFKYVYALGENITFNREKWYQGDFTELNRSLKNTEDLSNVGASIVVETLRDGRLRNKAYTKKFIHSDQVAMFQDKVYGKPYISKLIQRDRDNKTAVTKKYFEDWEKLILMMNDGFYPCQDFFYNGYIKPYVAEENLVAGNDLLIK